MTLKANYRASLTSFLYILPGQECLPSQRQPHEGSEAMQGLNELESAKDRIQKVIVPAGAGLLISMAT